MTDIRRSPLDAVHRELGAKMVPFGGWDMPLSYPEGTLAEHRACRHGAVRCAPRCLRQKPWLYMLAITSAVEFDANQPMAGGVRRACAGKHSRHLRHALASARFAWVEADGVRPERCLPHATVRSTNYSDLCWFPG